MSQTENIHNNNNSIDNNTNIKEINPKKIPLKLSVGIGVTFQDAEKALKIAKSKKNNNKLFNVEIHNPKIENSEDNNSNSTNSNNNNNNKKDIKKTEMIVDSKLNTKIVDSYLELENKFIKEKDPKSLGLLKNFLYDPKTKLLNRVGYIIETNKLKSKNLYNERAIIYLDVDNLHDINDKLGYHIVDKFINLIGKELNILDSNLLPHRRNDSAGDEFVIDIHTPEQNLQLAKKIVERYLKKIYLKEQELYDKENISKYL